LPIRRFVNRHWFLIGVISLGLLVRLLLMPFSLHVDPRFTGDVATFSWAAQQWTSAEGTRLTFLYPPLAFHTLSTYLLHLARPFTQELLGKPIHGLEAQLNWLSSPFVFRNLFVLKAWYLVPDLGCALLLWGMLQDRPARARLGLLAWVFNPLVLYTAYFHGQLDLIPVFFAVLSLFVARERHPTWAAFWMGIGACYKNFPFAFLLPLVLVLDKTWSGRLKLFLVGALPYVLLFVPSISRYSYAGLDSYYSKRFFTAGYQLGYGTQVYFLFVFYAALLWYLHHHKARTFEALWRACFAILLVYYQVSEFDLHYWVWIVPFAAIYWVERPREAKPFYLAIGLCLLVLLAPTPLARFFAPISPRFFLRLPSLVELLNPYLPMLFIVNVVRSLLAGTCFYLAWKLLRDIPASRAHPEIRIADGAPMERIADERR